METRLMNDTSVQPVHPGPKPSLMLGRLQIDLWQQWIEWFRDHYNWKNFTLIEISYELENYCEAHEVQLSLLGFCMRLTYWYGKRSSDLCEHVFSHGKCIWCDHSANPEAK
jgi:hypothetical protein